jgi:hypothetical protein
VPSRWYRFSRFARRNRAALALGSLAALTLIVGTVISLQQASRAEREAQTARRELARAERVSEFLGSLYREHDPLSRDAAVARSPAMQMAEAVARVETELSEDPVSQAQLLRVLGETQLHLSQIDASRTTLDLALSKLGDSGGLLLRAEIESLRGAVASRELRLEDAERHIKSALSLATQAAGPESIAVGRINTQAAYTLLSMARYKDAKPAAENAHRVLANALGANHPESIRALVTLALVQEVLREDAQALINIRAAIAMLEQRFGATNARLSRPLHILGVLLRRQRNFDEARTTLIRGAEIARQHMGERSNSLANILTVRGEMERLAGDFPAALAALDQAEQAIPDDEVLGRAQLFMIRGSVYFDLGDGKRAEADYREVLRLRMNTGSPRSFSAWFSQAQVGDALALQGRFEEAHRLQEEAAAQTRILLGADDYQNTLILNRRAGTYAMQGDWRNSAIHKREAIRIVEKTYGRDHINYLFWNLNLADVLSKIPEGRMEAAQIADSLIETSRNNPKLAEHIAPVVLLRCDLYIASGETKAARSLAAAMLAEPGIVASAEQRNALQRLAL